MSNKNPEVAVENFTRTNALPEQRSQLRLSTPEGEGAQFESPG